MVIKILITSARHQLQKQTQVMVENHSNSNASKYIQASTTFKYIRDFIIGGTSGAIVKILIAPIQRAKTLLILQDSSPWPKENPYKGILDCMRRCLQKEGLTSLWKGQFAHTVRFSVLQAISFSTNDALKRVLLEGVNPATQKTKNMLITLLCGGLAGTFSLVLVYPTDIPKIVLVAGISKAPSGLKIPLRQKLAFLYQGFSMTALYIFVHRACLFGFYDAGKRLLSQTTQYGQQLSPSVLDRLVLAQLVALSSDTIGSPLEEIGRRLKKDGNKAEHDRRYNGALDCARKVLKSEGVHGLFKESFLGLSRSIGSALVLVLYDELQKIVDRERLRLTF